jgi:hypothetical protein
LLSSAPSVSTASERSHGVIAAVVECPVPLDKPAVEAVCVKESCHDGSGFLGTDLLPEQQLVDPDLHAKEVGINVHSPPFSAKLASAVISSLVGLTLEETATSTLGGFLGASVGRVHKCSSFWKKKLEADNYLMNIVKEGYKIPVYPGPDIIP